MTPFEVPQGRLQSPFYQRMKALDTVNLWHEWKGYTTPDELYCAETEYFAIRNSTGVFDITPMTKYRITGPDALPFLDRLMTRDMNKLAPGRVAYTVWCDDQGQVVDDGTIFHLREGDYRLCSQERHMAWLTASAVGFDVSIVDETHDVAVLELAEYLFFALEALCGKWIADLARRKVLQQDSLVRVPMVSQIELTSGAFSDEVLDAVTVLTGKYLVPAIQVNDTLILAMSGEGSANHRKLIVYTRRFRIPKGGLLNILDESRCF